MWISPVTSINLRCTMEERAGQWVARHLPRRCFENEPSAACAARLDDDAGFRNCGTYDLSTAKVSSMVRWCLVAHSGDNVCLRIFLTHGLHLAAGMGRHVGQWAVQCAPRESLVHGLISGRLERRISQSVHCRIASGLCCWRR